MNKIVSDFHKLYYGESSDTIYGRTYYRGLNCQKCPLDLWIYQEIFHDYKPQLIIELGTLNGGSALWLGDTVSNLGLDCEIISIDLYPIPNYNMHPKVKYITGNTVDPHVVNQIQNYSSKRTIVILDSDHSKEHVLKELNTYKNMIQIGGYLIVEDTNVNGHPVREDWGPGPFEAVTEFLKQNDNFEPDISREKFLMSFNNNGYLKRVR